MESVRINGPEQQMLDPHLPDGGLPPAIAVHSFQVFRASRDAADQTDLLGWTYHHHVDMACWKGRLYVAWNSCLRDEDVWPSRELYSWSTDGAKWAAPAELFPQGISTCLRIYFYHASNRRMLAIAGLRTDQADTSEAKKGALVVREIRADHSLGDVFVLRAFSQETPHALAAFERSPDAGFKEACRALLADTIYLEQQDRGRLLGPRRMKWHDAAAWPGGAVPGDNEKWVAGKAYSFYQRPDGVWVGFSKMGWVTESHDQGRNWSQPRVPPTLVTGKAKVWAQRTSDGRYALVYNPSRGNRFPLVVVSGADGVQFGGMRVVQGELPVQRYAGEHRSIGPQYVRGISRWADDGSRADHGTWLVYSMNKEDIWVSRLDCPLRDDDLADVHDDFSAFSPGAMIPGWNTYRPRWSNVEVAGGALRLQNRDPYDYAQAIRIFGPREQLSIRFDLAAENGVGALDVDLMTQFGSRRPIRLQIPAANAPARTPFRIQADTKKQTYSLFINGKSALENGKLAEAAQDFHRIVFRTGGHRGIGGANPVPAGTDVPGAPASWRIWNLSVSGEQDPGEKR